MDYIDRNFKLVPTAPPPAPVSSPVYEVAQQGRSAGLYMVDARNATPSDNDLIQLTATSFIFRVIQVELNMFGFYWLVGVHCTYMSTMVEQYVHTIHNLCVLS